MGFVTYVIVSCPIVTLLTGALSGTTSTTLAPIEVFSIPLTGYDDQFYAASVTVGFPGWNLLLTFDPTISGVVVAHDRFLGSNRTNRFDPGQSLTFQSTANLSDRMVGKDSVNAGSHTSWLEVDIMLTDDPADTAFEAFFTQPFDGLFYDSYAAFNAYTMAFRKTCKQGRTDNAGSVTYNGADGRLCGEFGGPTLPLPSCEVPLVNVEGVAWDHADGAPNPFRALILPGSDIILPQELFNQLKAEMDAELVEDKYVVGCNASFEQLTFMIDGVAYPVEFKYLVDQFDDECVLRVRPSDGDGHRYCKKICSGQFADLCPTMRVEGVLVGNWP